MPRGTDPNENAKLSKTGRRLIDAPAGINSKWWPE